MAFLGEEVTTGLSSVVLTDSSMIDSRKFVRVRGKRIPESACEAFYHEATHRRQPWIELIMDNIAATEPASLHCIPFMRELVIARTLFHEIGHHVYRSVGGTRFPASEAELWSADAIGRYLTHRYPIIARLGHILLRIARVSRRD
jgi:hypothetical protein